MIPPPLTVNQVTQICPEYTDCSEIGRGGFKTVFRVVKNGVAEVIKVVSIPRGDGSDDRQRFREESIGRIRREVEILNRCQTPSLVKLATLPLTFHEVGGFDYVLYSEEFLDGEDLWKILRAATIRPEEGEARLLMKCLLEAIRELWSMRYIHRDIKPSNVIKLNDRNRPFVLLDLGIAFSLLETALTNNAAHRDPPATFRYLAPEMGDPNFRANLDFRADLYTSALTVFEYATGEHPIARDSDDAIRTVTRALRIPARPLADLRSDYSSEFCRLIDQLLKKKPALRPANLDALMKKLED